MKRELIRRIKSLPKVTSKQWSYEEMIELIDIFREIGQLDELEVLSQEWIDEHVKAVTYDEIPDQTEVVYVDDLKELLVPKQKEVKRAQIPKWIIDWYQGANNELSTLEDVFDNLSHDTGYNIVDSEEVRSHIVKYGGFSKMYEALSHIYFGVYEIEEEEQKYYVKDSKGSYILAKIKGEIMTMGEILEFYGHESVDIDYNLTEQEIKDYDERFWAFAVPVEGVEE